MFCTDHTGQHSGNESTQGSWQSLYIIANVNLESPQ